MSMRKRIIKRYSEAFKKEVVREYLEGESVNVLKKKYGIGGDHTIRNWVKRYAGREGLAYEVIRIQKPEEYEELKRKEEEIKKLKKIISDMTIKNVLLEEEINFYKEERIKRDNKKKQFKLLKRQKRGRE